MADSMREEHEFAFASEQHAQKMELVFDIDSSINLTIYSISLATGEFYGMQYFML